MSPPPITLNTPEERARYFVPKHINSPGTPVVLNAQTPTLFTPLNIRGVTLRNRIVVAPMCQFSTSHEGPSIGKLTPYHVATLGHYALKGAALTFIEATGVQPNGRISPNCPGIWDDAQIEGVRTVAEFIQAQGGLCGLQLAHAGRKASTVAPWVAARQKKQSVRAGTDVGGWPENVVGPMGGDSQTWDGKGLSAEGGFWAPRQLSESDIRDLVKAWADAALRGIAAGVDVIEIHAAHGYLIHEFLSPITNQRTDRYGGSFENRIRLLLEIVGAVRQVMPPAMPLFLRLSSTEWMEKTETGKRMGSWDVESTIRLAKMLPELGVDLLDVSSGGNHPEQIINVWETKDYQTLIAARIRKEVKASGASLLIGAVGLITEAEQARDIVEDSEAVGIEAQAAKRMTDRDGGRQPMADVILVGRQFMREPEWVLKVASKLGLDVAWPIQFLRFSSIPCAVGIPHLGADWPLSSSARFFHIDFGFIVGRDSKPFAPLIKVCKEKVEGLGGTTSSQYAQSKEYCFTAYFTLRKTSNLILNLFSLMVQSSIPDVIMVEEQMGGVNGAVGKVRERFQLDVSEGEVVQFLDQVVTDSVNAVLEVGD